MSKKTKINNSSLESIIMGKVRNDEITIKPKWFFLLGSFALIVSFSFLSIFLVFLTNIFMFSLRQHGPMGEWRLQNMINSFPWWIPILVFGGIVMGVVLLKKYDFSYKKNFRVIIIGFILSIVFAAFIIDNLGINKKWSKRGPMRGLYQQNR